MQSWSPHALLMCTCIDAHPLLTLSNCSIIVWTHKDDAFLRLITFLSCVAVAQLFSELDSFISSVIFLAT